MQPLLRSIHSASALGSGIDAHDARRIRTMLDFIADRSTANMLRVVMGPHVPGEVYRSIARHCTFAHGALLIFPKRVQDALDLLASWQLSTSKPVPSVAVRERVMARQKGLGTAPEVTIVEATRSLSPDVSRLEIFILPTGEVPDIGDLIAEERAHNRESHFAFRLRERDPVVLNGLRHLLTTAAGFVCDGGAYNPHQDCSVFYFRSLEHPRVQDWPRRMELLAPGNHADVLREHKADTSRGRGVAETEEPAQSLLELMTGAWTTQAIHAAARLNIADHIWRGKCSVASLVEATGAQPDPLERLLCFLVDLGLVERDAEAGYRLTKRGELLRGDVVGSMRDLACLYGGVFYQSFAALEHAIRTGENAFRHVFGLAPFDYFAENPDQARIFERAMAAGSHYLRDLPLRIDLDKVKTVVDVGGGDGELISHFLAHDPRLRAVLVDRAHVTESARKKLSAKGVLDRCEIIAGDFTQEIPEGGDLYVLSRILHDWDDDQCYAILKRCRSAMLSRGDARLAIVERPIPDAGVTKLARSFDIHMMVNNVGGRERSSGEYDELLRASGFALYEQIPLSLGMMLFLARPVPDTAGAVSLAVRPTGSSD